MIPFLALRRACVNSYVKRGIFNVGNENLANKCNHIRSISCSTTRYEEKEKRSGSFTDYQPSSFDKRILVWTKKYPNVEAVPNFIPQNQMERARNLVRVYTMIGMMVITVFASYIMVRLGKKAVERGESVTKMNEEWHKQMNEQAAAREAK